MVVSLGGRPTPDADALRAVLAAHRAGERVAVEWVQRGVRRTGELVFAENPAVEVVTLESTGAAVPPAARAFRERWLAPRGAP